MTITTTSCERSDPQQLLIRSKDPYNAEPPLRALTKSKLTPAELVYCRNHGPLPQLNGHTHTITIDGEVEGAQILSVKQLLDMFPARDVVAVLQCAGNRRKTMSEKRKVEGLLWEDGAVCNVKWRGISLRDVLLWLGVNRSAVGQQKHVCFASHSSICEQDNWFGSSIPLERALDTEADVLLAFEMNGEALTHKHGFPLRIVIPGYCGVRWVKWLDHITVASMESSNFYQQKDYKILPAEVNTAEDARRWWSKIPPLQELWLNSAVTSIDLLPSEQGPKSDKQEDSVSSRHYTIFVKGYATNRTPSSDEGKSSRVTPRVCKVDVSTDSGNPWLDAQIIYQEGKWSWTLWEITLNVCRSDSVDSLDVDGRKIKQIVVWSRAHDDMGATQSTHEDCSWNLRGVAYNGYGQGSMTIPY